ncbi:S-adenosylmethionine:tRNA ribosyltransferase-isomerase [Bacteroidota bacterium]
MYRSINIADYTYDLPEERIAKYPISPRDGSKLLVYNRGEITHGIFRELPDMIDRDTLLVFNDTRVVQARLKFRKSTGSKIEIFCLEPHEPADYVLAFQKTSECVWKCLVGNAKKWKEEPLQMDLRFGTYQFRIRAYNEGREKEAFLIRFEWDQKEISFGDILEEAGKTPIPPYLNREAESVDKDTYQTVYSRIDGSVAAPTAGLHFTRPLFTKLEERGIPKLDLTLHVGAGTFQPVSSKSLEDHSMHAEHFYFNRSSIESLLMHQGNIMAVGTTSTRILESIYLLGIRLNSMHPHNDSTFFLDQWEAYKLPQGQKSKSLENILRHMDRYELESLEGITRLMIVPGYKFRMVDRLLTNYHQPNSTLLLLVSAFIGEDWRKVYKYAMDNNFRFLSYGDSSLLIPSA